MGDRIRSLAHTDCSPGWRNLCGGHDLGLYLYPYLFE